AVQRLGPDLARPEEDPGNRDGHGRGESQGAQDRPDGVAHELRAVDSHADVHGLGESRTAVLVNWQKSPAATSADISCVPAAQTGQAKSVVLPAALWRCGASRRAVGFFG